MANRGSILILAALIFLGGSILYNYKTKSFYKSESKRVALEQKEVLQTKDLQKLWRAKGMKSKLEKALAQFRSKSLKIERKKAIIDAKNLNYTELNKMLNKLASLPLQFRDLVVSRSGDNFNLECTCVW
jgi:hypothetical protein